MFTVLEIENTGVLLYNKKDPENCRKRKDKKEGIYENEQDRSDAPGYSNLDVRIYAGEFSERLCV